jgi:hypothetical protein
VVAGVGFYPSPIFGSALGQHLRGDRILAMHVTKEMHDVLGPGQEWQVSRDDDAVKTVVYKNQEAQSRLGLRGLIPSVAWVLAFSAS